MNKLELLTTLEDSREKFLEVIENLPENAALKTMDRYQWTLKDTLAHLSRWEAELIKILWQLNNRNNLKGFKIDDTYDLDQRNYDWYIEAKSRPYERVLDDFHSVRNQTVIRIEVFSNAQLSQKITSNDSKSKNLYELIAEYTYEHEQEHLDEIIKEFTPNRN